MTEEILRALDVPSDIQVRDLTRRELDIRIMPWDQEIETRQGRETFARGAFHGTDPGKVLLMGLEHEAHLGLGQNGQARLTRRPVGKGLSIDERDDAAYMTFRVSRTQRGDEVLALADDGIVTGASIEFAELPGGSDVETRGRRTKVHRRVRLTGLSTTHEPAFDAGVIAVRNAEEGDPPVAESPVVETTPPPAAPAPVDLTPITDALAIQTRSQDALGERMAQLEERYRSDFWVPTAIDTAAPDFLRGDWMKLVLRMMTGEHVSQSEIEYRTAADLITTDNLGVVPEAFLSEIIGLIDPSRPFLSSTRRLTTPRAGMQLTVPKIVTRPTVGVQADEKDELVSTPTSITNVSFEAVTIGGYGDISLQLLKRSDPSYLDLYLELLGEAYAVLADDLAVDTLLAASGIHTGPALIPDDLALGVAWANASAVSRRLVPDTIWLSSQAVAAFIDAKASGTNAPLYSDLAANFTAGGGTGGTISGLRPVHVPSLDDEAVDIIVGPSRGFAWAEDGTFTLQVDVPAKAGRDVALVGIDWFAPLYPAAFTKFALGS